MSADLRMISVSDILRNLTYSGDCGRIESESDWFALFAAKVAHDHFDWLADRIMENGFTVPVCIYESGTGWSVGNGHHRLCAAILLGLDAIPVFWGDSWAADSHDGDQCPDDEMRTDYWDMLSENMEGVHRPDRSRAWRLQYGGGNDEDEDDDDDVQACNCDLCCPPPCPVCGDSDCDAEAHICSECNGESDYHYPACSRARWDLVYCRECGYVYRENLCEHIFADEWDAAIRDHEYRFGPILPPGAYIPDGVLREAYAEHEAWLADAPLREAYAECQRAAEDLRAIAAASCRYSTAVIFLYAQDLIDAKARWLAL